MKKVILTAVFIGLSALPILAQMSDQDMMKNKMGQSNMTGKMMIGHNMHKSNMTMGNKMHKKSMMGKNMTGEDMMHDMSGMMRQMSDMMASGSRVVDHKKMMDMSKILGDMSKTMKKMSGQMMRGKMNVVQTKKMLQRIDTMRKKMEMMTQEKKKDGK